MTRPLAKPARGILNPTLRPTRVTHARLGPSPALAPFVEHFWTVRWDLGEASHLAQTLPHPSVHLSIEGAAHDLVGVHTRRFTRTLEGSGRVFAVKFRPGMFSGFLGKPVSTLANRRVPLERLFGPPGARFAAQVEREAGFERCIELAEAFLLARAPALDASAVLVRELVERLAGDRTLLTVEQICALAGLPLRTVQRLFRQHAGVSPKWVVSRYRLHEALERLAADPAQSLAQLALELGYADQPHFSRDFKAMIGLPARAYAASLRSAGR
jgi:AraC-like DNA-binding protein